MHEANSNGPTMRLKLRRETVRMLTNREAAAVIGGGGKSCTTCTNGCGPTLASTAACTTGPSCSVTVTTLTQ